MFRRIAFTLSVLIVLIVVALAVFTALQPGTSEGETSPTYVKWFKGQEHDFGGPGGCVCTIFEMNAEKAIPMPVDIFSRTI
jgi:hypothetical protein